MNFSAAKTKETVKGVLSKWGKKVGQAAKKTSEVLSKSTWRCLKTAPGSTAAAAWRIAQGAKVMAKGGREKIFRQTFTVYRDEQLRQAYGCNLYTSAGPVVGVLYLSSAKIAFCSDRPVSYTLGNKTGSTYYKVVIPLENLKEIKPSSVSRVDVNDKYVLVISINNHEFWFSGFVHYDNAVKNLRQQTLDVSHESRVQMNSQLEPELLQQTRTRPLQAASLPPAAGGIVTARNIVIAIP